jgi:hypothetical protein
MAVISVSLQCSHFVSPGGICLLHFGVYLSQDMALYLAMCRVICISSGGSVWVGSGIFILWISGLVSVHTKKVLCVSFLSGFRAL